MTTYSTLFFAGDVTAAQKVLFTVGSSSVVVLRDIEAHNPTVDGDSLIIGWTGPPGLAGYFLPVQKVPVGEARQWQGRVVLPAGTVVHANALAGDFQIVVSGYDLVGS